MENILLITALILSCGIVLIATPPIVRVAKAKNIFDETNSRKIHKSSIPNLGGISLFMAITITATILTVGYNTTGFQLVFASMVLLFFVGIKDDIIYIAPNTKLFIQLIAAFILVGLGKLTISNFEGLLGLYQVPPILAYPFTMIFIVLMINAYNLIDGIDGLAGSLGIMASAFFAVWFYMNGFHAMAILSVSLIGALAGFLRFNLFSKEYKIFMGDTGSLLLGLLMAVQVIWFLAMNHSAAIPYPTAYAPVIALSVIAVPLMDTLRVFTLRIVRGQPPFYPDKNHLHHRMLTFLPRHLHSSVGITVANLFVFLSAVALSYTGLNINIQFLFILSISVCMCIFPGLLERIIRKKNGIVRPLLQPHGGLKIDTGSISIRIKGQRLEIPSEEEVLNP